MFFLFFFQNGIDFLNAIYYVFPDDSILRHVDYMSFSLFFIAHVTCNIACGNAAKGDSQSVSQSYNMFHG